MNFKMILLVGLGGFVGTVARYLCGLGIQTFLPAAGLTTLVVNILGSFFIGYVLGGERFQPGMQTVLTVGVLGGFTTFSAFSADTVFAFRDEHAVWALGYVALMLFLCFAATLAGILFARMGLKA